MNVAVHARRADTGGQAVQLVVRREAEADPPIRRAMVWAQVMNRMAGPVHEFAFYGVEADDPRLAVFEIQRVHGVKVF